MKNYLKRGLLGIPVGIAIGHLITVIIALIEGSYIGCTPALVEAMGSDVNAVLLQTVLCGVLGFVFGTSSIIWDKKDWTIVKKTLLYFVITLLANLIVAFVCKWIPITVKGILLYTLIYVVTYIAVWIGLYFGYGKAKQ